MVRDQDLDSLLNRADELLKYLGHLNKLEHISVVTELIRRLSASEGVVQKQGNKLLAAERSDRMLRDMTVGSPHPGVHQDPSRMGQVIQLPQNTRKVSIEL